MNTISVCCVTHRLIGEEASNANAQQLCQSYLRRTLTDVLAVRLHTAQSII